MKIEFSYQGDAASSPRLTHVHCTPFSLRPMYGVSHTDVTAAAKGMYKPVTFLQPIQVEGQMSHNHVEQSHNNTHYLIPLNA